MRLPDDDEVYEVDQTYLGPPGRYIAAMRYRAIFAWLVIGPLTFVTMRKIDFPFTVLTVSLTVIAITAAAMFIADHATNERPVTSLFTTLWHEVSTPRADDTTFSASGSGFERRVHPGGELGRWLARHRDGPAQPPRGGRIGAWLVSQRHPRPSRTTSDKASPVAGE